MDSSPWAVQVEGLSKSFDLTTATSAARYQTLRDALSGWARSWFAQRPKTTPPLPPWERVAEVTRPGEGEVEPLSLAATSSAPSAPFFALRDISFTVPTGSATAVIGANGAGKSTLLKILARVTRPTSGRVRLRGRTASLLEVGTGFHPELTGRENIFLSGAVLGMSRREIRQQFDAIVDFAQTAAFLDVPLKRYSSGMYVRLAFAVAAHLPAEVLLLDEVLAVGDAAFQRRCLTRIQDSAQQGRTILLVSHNLGAVRSLCSQAIWLDRGCIAQTGPVADVLAAYSQQSLAEVQSRDLDARVAALPADPNFRFTRVSVRQAGQATTQLWNGLPWQLECDFEVLQPMRGCRVYFDLCDERQELLVRSFHDEEQPAADLLPIGRYTAIADIPAPLLAPRDYLLLVSATWHNQRSLVGGGLPILLSVQNSGERNQAYPDEPIRGLLQPGVKWTCTPIESNAGKEER